MRTSPRHRCKCWGRDTCVVFGFRLDQSGFFSENLFFSFFKEVGIFMICLMRFAYSKYLLNFTLFRFNSIIIHYHYISYYTAYTFILLIIIILIFELRKENLKRITHMYHAPQRHADNIQLHGQINKTQNMLIIEPKRLEQLSQV